MIKNHHAKKCGTVDIGAMFDPELSMSTQVKKLCRQAWINLHNIGNIRSYLTEDQTKTTDDAYVT